MLAGARSVPVSVFDEVDRATSWMRPQLGVDAAGDLAQSVEIIRGELPPLS